MRKVKEAIIINAEEKEAALEIYCYDLDQKGKCWQRTHKQLLTRNEKVEQSVAEMDSKKAKRSKGKKEVEPTESTDAEPKPSTTRLQTTAVDQR